MSPRSGLSHAMVLLAACGCLSAGAQTLFKCVQKDGKVRYQDQQCTEDTKQSEVQKPGAPGTPAPAPIDTSTSAGAKKAADEKNLAAEVDAVMDIVLSYEGCAQAFPAFASKFGSTYQGWKTRNRAAFTRYEQDPEAAAKVQKRVAEQKKELQGDAAAMRCDKMIGPMIGRAAVR